ncbi:hypothetical protein KC19_10G058000 [Ceratodon purpureus]|uniref:Uncharacterized protein n=1 Tax=Ceratodon purpureus TaxID=3225 RepID=A0A8T0GJS1_CERPU|nr:hypothetical protein KC19_10G058000 [Ceratodon purpureus]
MIFIILFSSPLTLLCYHVNQNCEVSILVSFFQPINDLSTVILETFSVDVQIKTCEVGSVL